MSETDEWITETRSTHYYKFYGRLLTGYGPSMDPHRCGDPTKPCWTVTEVRKVTPWATTTHAEDTEATTKETDRG